MKKFFYIILALIGFTNSYAGTNGVRFNADDDDDILNQLENSFDKMNLDGSFDRRSDQANFNLRVATMMKSPVIRSAVGQGVPLAMGGGSAQSLIASSEGDLNLTVTRNTVNIAGIALPYILFGANDFRASYVSTISGFLPAGVVLTSVTTLASGAVRFTYTQTAGGAVDTIDVAFTGLSNYATFLASMSTTFFKTRYILYSISNISNLSQFFNLISFGNLTALGAKGFNQLSPNSRKLPSDFQDDRVNLLFPEQSVNPDWALVQNFGAFAMTVNYDIFMSKKSEAFKRA